MFFEARILHINFRDLITSVKALYTTANIPHNIIKTAETNQDGELHPSFRPHASSGRVAFRNYHYWQQRLPRCIIKEKIPANPL